MVTLVRQGIKDTTDSAGNYLLAVTNLKELPLLQPKNTSITLYKNFLDFSLIQPSEVKVELFDMKGNLLKKSYLQNAQKGFYRFNITENAGAEKFLIIRASIGEENVIIRYLTLSNGSGKISMEYSNPSGNKFAKITAIDDTIKASAKGYKEKVIPVNSYNLELNITLDTLDDRGVRPSPGCGKPAPFTGEKRFTINVPSAGTREYIIRLPDDYDPNHPYALWFAIHCLNGTAEGVAKGGAGNNYEYYGIWKFANPKGQKGTTIFCSPQGINNAWAQGQKDLDFFRAMINKFENELCIDMSRIFASGFSRVVQCLMRLLAQCQTLLEQSVCILVEQ